CRPRTARAQLHEDRLARARGPVMANRKTGTARPKRRSLKIRTGDRVQVMSGKDRGKSGRVLRVEPTRERVYVEHLNMIKRHTRPQQVAGARGERQMGGGM